MHRIDAKLQLLAELCRPGLPADLALLGALTEVTEHRAGAVVAPAGYPGRWITRIVRGELATTVPARCWRAPEVLAHGSETALVAVSDVVLLMLAAADLPHAAALLPDLGEAGVPTSEELSP